MPRKLPTEWVIAKGGTHQKFYLGLMVLGSAVSLIIAGLLAFCIARSQYRETFNLEAMLVFEAACLVFGVIFLVAAELMVVSSAPKALMKVEEEVAEQRDLLADQTTPNSKEIVQKNLSKCLNRAANFKDIMDDIGKVLAFSDAPLAIAFSVIFILVFVNALGWMGDGSALFPPFIAGAVAFQLLYSNFVFYLEANGAFPELARKIIPKLDLLTPMIQGYSTSVDSRQARTANSAVEPTPVVGADDHNITTSVQGDKE